MRSFRSLRAIVFCNAWIRGAATSFGSPAGPQTPYQFVWWNPAKPASSIVRNSGAALARTGVVTARARTRPFLTNGRIEGRESNIICTCPPTRSVIAGALLLYGTCTMSMPAILLNCSAARCDELPGLGVAKFSFPGFAFAWATSSATLLKGRSLLTTRMNGMELICPIGVKSFSESYGSFIRCGRITWIEVFSTSIVPSGAARATAPAPMVPLAPARLSTMTERPSASDSGGAMTRATTSVGPPAG